MTSLAVEEKIEAIIPLISQYPSEIQVSILKYSLLYFFKNESKESVLGMCKKIKYNLAVQKKTSKLEPLLPQKLDSIALNLGLVIKESDVESEIINRIAEALDDLKKRLHVISDDKKPTSGKAESISATISNIIEKEKNTKSAMNDSVEEMFDRILSSLDPATAERFLDHSIKRKETERKAAMYEAMCDKYEQLFDYHETGRLVKDFRRLYLDKLKE